MNIGRLTLISGGARSGKSSVAQALALQVGPRRLFVATAEAWDDEMRARIDAHREERAENFVTLEAPLDLTKALATQAPRYDVILIDCLTLWISNLMLAGLQEPEIRERVIEGLSSARSRADHVLLVSNEVGCGIVPDHPLARSFRDISGRLQQILAAAADRTYLVFMGRALPLHRLGLDPRELRLDD